MPPTVASVNITNKRPVFAKIDAGRSCIFDPEMGAFNIALADRVLPPEGWLRIHHISFSYVTVNLNIFMSPPQQELPEIGDRQRMFLSIRWEDGEQEDVDITYKVISIDTLTRTLPQTSARR